MPTKVRVVMMSGRTFDLDLSESNLVFLGEDTPEHTVMKHSESEGVMTLFSIDDVRMITAIPTEH